MIDLAKFFVDVLLLENGRNYFSILTQVHDILLYGNMLIWNS